MQDAASDGRVYAPPSSTTTAWPRHARLTTSRQASADARDRRGASLVTLDRLWLVAAAAVPLLYALAQPLGLVDFWIWAAAGQHLLATHQLTWLDTFSYPEPYRAWVNQAPLPEALYAALLAVAGPGGAVVLQAILTAATFGLLARMCVSRGARPACAAIGTLAAFVVASPALTARPQSFALLYFVAALALLRRAPTPRIAGAMAALGLLWAWSHGSLILGLGLLAVALVGMAVDRRYGFGAPAGWSLPGAVALVTLMAIGGSLGPQGTALYDFAATVTGNPVIRQHVQEWQPLVLTSLQGYLVLGSAVLALCALVVDVRRMRLADVLPLLLALVFTLQAQRGLIWWALLLPPVLASGLEGFATRLAQVRTHSGFQRRTHSGLQRRTRRVHLAVWRRRPGAVRMPSGLWWASLTDGAQRAAPWSIAALLAGLCVAVAPGLRSAVPMPALAARPVLDPATPADAVRFLLRSGAHGDIFTPPEWAGYLLAELGPRARTFVDVRIERFSGATWSRYYGAVAASKGWQRTVGTADYVVLPRHSTQALAAALAVSPHWRLAYRDALAVIYRRGLS